MIRVCSHNCLSQCITPNLVSVVPMKVNIILNDESMTIEFTKGFFELFLTQYDIPVLNMLIDLR